MANPSPLRYPGGKYKLSKYIQKIIYTKKLNKSIYVEPFCGGAAVAFDLLINGHVKEIIINDFDKSIYAFWYSVLNYTDELCDMIKKTEINIEEWEKQRVVQNNKESMNLLKLGFSTLFLNRTNRSGILKAGVIGGKAQNGAYKLDCRFNKQQIINKIKLIAKFKDRVYLYNMDTENLIENVIKKINKKCFIFFDPPYYEKGASLYIKFYKHKDHLNLSKSISKIKNHSWIVTYDNNPEIRSMYKNFKKETYTLNYSVQKRYKGEEIIVYSNTISRVAKEEKININFYLN